MKKNLYLSMFAAVGMLLATSCSNDETELVSSGNEAQVTFSVGLEKSIGTRAISDGTGANKLVYAIYDADGTLITTTTGSTNGQFTKESAFPDGGLKDNVTVTLAKGQTYKAVFWAQNSSCTAYDTSDLTCVTVDYSTGANNDETRDAFYASETFTVDGDKAIDVTLKRPFAQINVGVTADDWDAAVKSGITVTTSKVEIKQAATTINLLTGKTGTPQDVTYALDEIPNETLSADADGDGTKETYRWLSMSYILVDDGSEDGASKATLDGLQFTFHPENGTDIVFADGLNSVPVQRNWRTNILGRILSGDVTFNIIIDPDFDDDNNVEAMVSTVEELKEALSDPSITNVTLQEDLAVNEEMAITSEKKIDLNNKTLTTTQDLGSYNGGVLTLTNGKIIQQGGSSVKNLANGTIELDDVEYEGTGWSCICNVENAQNAKITIRNSTIKGGYYAVTTNASTNPVGNTVITLENSTFIADETALLINVPSNVTATNCTFQGGWQGAFLRGGTYAFTDCNINLVMDASYGDCPENNANSDGTWSSGNQAVTAALLIGNRGKLNDAGYNYPTSVTLTKTKFSVSGTNSNGKTAQDINSVYVWSREEENNGTTFNYDDASYNSFNSAGAGLYVGNDGKNLTVNGSTYSPGI